MSRMLDFKERSRLRRAMYAKPTIIFMAVVLSFILHGAWGMYQKSTEAGEKSATAEERLAELREREKVLSADILELSTDGGVENAIRDRFMVAKQGESVMIISDAEAKKVHTVTVADEKPSYMQQFLGATGFVE